MACLSSGRYCSRKSPRDSSHRLNRVKTNWLALIFQGWSHDVYKVMGLIIISTVHYSGVKCKGWMKNSFIYTINSSHSVSPWTFSLRHEPWSPSEQHMSFKNKHQHVLVKPVSFSDTFTSCRKFWMFSVVLTVASGSVLDWKGFYLPQTHRTLTEDALKLWCMSALKTDLY